MPNSELHPADPRANQEYWCSTCKERHKPSADHPVCPSSDDHLHAKFPNDLYIDFKGWRFYPPFHCMYCGIEVCPHQWAFSRSCGGCDVSDSHTARLSIFDGRIFAGRRDLIDDNDSHFIPADRFLPPSAAEKFPVRNPPKPWPVPTAIFERFECDQNDALDKLGRMCLCTCLHTVHPVENHSLGCPEYREVAQPTPEE